MPNKTNHNLRWPVHILEALAFYTVVSVFAVLYTSKEPGSIEDVSGIQPGVLDEYQVERMRLQRVRENAFESADKDNNDCLTGDEKDLYGETHRSILYWIIQSEDHSITDVSLDSLTTRQLEAYILERAERKSEAKNL